MARTTYGELRADCPRQITDDEDGEKYACEGTVAAPYRVTPSSWGYDGGEPEDVDASDWGECDNCGAADWTADEIRGFDADHRDVVVAPNDRD